MGRTLRTGYPHGVEVSRSYLFDRYIASLQGGMVRASPHRHAAFQLTVSLDGKSHRVGADLQSARPGLVHLVGSNVPHAFDGGDGEQLLLWLPPESSVGRRLAHTHLSQAGIGALPENRIAGLRLDGLQRALYRAVPAANVNRQVEALLSMLSQGTTAPPVPVHPAVRKAIRVIRSLETAQISAEELASRVGLSRSRFLHVFKQDMGIPLRPYLQWLRCIDALALLAEGHNVTEAALAAGFTDGAHCNRVIKRYVCLSPSVMAATDMQVSRCRAELTAD